MVTYCALLAGLMLSGITLAILSRYSDGDLHSLTLFRLSLATTGVLFLVLIGLPLCFSRLQNTFHSSRRVDSLTGCINRQTFEQIFEQALLEARHSMQPLSLLVVDIDRFRNINEEHGHLAGDATLTMLSRSIIAEINPSSIVCRWDGNQFLVVLRNCQVKEGCEIACKLLEKIRQQPLLVDKKQIRVTASIGIAQMVAADNVQTLIARAQTGLYSARDTGRDTCAIGYDWILIDYCGNSIF